MKEEAIERAAIAVCRVMYPEAWELGRQWSAFPATTQHTMRKAVRAVLNNGIQSGLLAPATATKGAYSAAVVVEAHKRGYALGLSQHPDAVPAAPAPNGWKLVPVMPTDKMTSEGQRLRASTVNSITVVYRAMIDAAPVAPAPAAQAGAPTDADIIEIGRNALDMEPAKFAAAIRELFARQQSATAFGVEVLIRDCIPGGTVCDPQAIADAIREWAQPWRSLDDCSVAEWDEASQAARSANQSISEPAAAATEALRVAATTFVDAWLDGDFRLCPMATGHAVAIQLAMVGDARR